MDPKTVVDLSLLVFNIEIEPIRINNNSCYCINYELNQAIEYIQVAI